jgi:hypothetical protein
MMAGLSLGFDAAFPPGKPYPGSKVVCGYIGGNTPHIWTLDEWHRFADLTQFPIWVGYNDRDPEADARTAVSRMEELGWTKGLVNNTRAVILDFETEINPEWVDDFAVIVRANGYQTMPYGSESTILQDPVRAGRWIALYDERADIPADPGAVAHQYKANVPWNGTAVDLSVWSAEGVLHGGTGPRH